MPVAKRYLILIPFCIIPLEENQSIVVFLINKPAQGSLAEPCVVTALTQELA